MNDLLPFIDAPTLDPAFSLDAENFLLRQNQPKPQSSQHSNALHHSAMCAIAHQQTE
jgi:hypothetical protein